MWFVHEVCSCGLFMWFVHEVCSCGLFMRFVHVVCSCGLLIFVFVWFGNAPRLLYIIDCFIKLDRVSKVNKSLEKTICFRD